VVAALDLAHFFLRGLRFERDLAARERQLFLGEPGAAPAGESAAARSCRPLPRMICTTSSRRQPTTSTNLPFLPSPTARMRSLAFSAAVHRRGAAGQDVQHGDVVVDELQRRADALVRQAHLDAVLLGIARREVAGMRIEHVCERVHEHFEDVVARDLLGALQHALVALLQNVARFRPGLLGQHQRHGVVLDALAPDLVQLFGGLGPRRLGAVELERLVDGEIGLGLQQLQRVRDALAVADLEAIEIVNTGSS
jgi:hypothetical protein